MIIINTLMIVILQYNSPIILIPKAKFIIIYLDLKFHFISHLLN